MLQTKIMSNKQLFIRVEPEHDTRVKVFVPWQRKDWIQQIKSMPNRAWNKEKRYWSVPKNEATLLTLNALFGAVLKVSPDLQIGKDQTKNANSQLFKKEMEKPAINLTPAKDLTFKEIQQGNERFKVFVGQKVIIRKTNKSWLQVWIPYDKKGWIAVVQTIIGRKWDQGNQCWLIPYVKDSIEQLHLIGIESLVYNFVVDDNIPSTYSLPIKVRSGAPKVKLNEIHQKALTAFEDRLMIERCSWRTIKSYKSHLRGLFNYYSNIYPSQIDSPKITSYLLHQIKTKRIAESTQNQLVNALKAFYERVCKQPDKVKFFVRPKKKPKQLPNILSKIEVEKLLNCVTNLKHKAILSLIYSAGLRKSELRNLRKKDILFSRKRIFVRRAKGKKDRFVMLSPKIENMLHRYIKTYSPKYWLFEGQTKGQYSETSLQNIFTKAKEKSKVNPYITIHGLRHSFATHLHEAGVPLLAIKDLLGHNSIKTTEIYLHLSDHFMKSIQSPLDFLNID